jgi:hypothetical protein
MCATVYYFNLKILEHIEGTFYQKFMPIFVMISDCEITNKPIETPACEQITRNGALIFMCKRVFEALKS